MNLNAALDVITGLVLMYLLLSLFCTTINEIISTLCSLRARTLKKTLQQLIDDPRLKTLFYDHGLIDGTKVAVSGGNKGASPSAAPAAAPAPPAGAPAPTAMAVSPTPPATRKPDAWYAFSHPSYFSGKTVASALTGSLLNYVQSDEPLPVDATFAQLRTAVQQLPVNTNIRDALSACLVDANQNVDKFRENVAAWFDASMDRLSGSYKRNLQIISFLVGIVLATIFNADTLNVANRLWNDHTLGAMITQNAAAVVDQNGTVSNPKCTQDAQGTDGDISKSITKMCALNADLHQLPIGWNNAAWHGWIAFFEGVFSYEGLWSAIGILITSIALMQGAPFWFDLLQKIMNFRATGTKPKKAADPS
jgi:hypothetical protein